MKTDPKLIFELECRRYLAEVKLLCNLDKKHAIPIAIYILCSSMAMPMKTIIVAERPYTTDIHPEVSSAMSYDMSKTRPTPSTAGIAHDLQNSLGCKYIEVERWFRDSWKYLGSGTLVINCILFTQYSSSHSSKESVAFQRWLRSALEYSAAISSSNIDLVCIGVPA